MLTCWGHPPLLLVEGGGEPETVVYLLYNKSYCCCCSVGRRTTNTCTFAPTYNFVNLSSCCCADLSRSFPLLSADFFPPRPFSPVVIWVNAMGVRRAKCADVIDRQFRRIRDGKYFGPCVVINRRRVALNETKKRWESHAPGTGKPQGDRGRERIFDRKRRAIFIHNILRCINTNRY